MIRWEWFPVSAVCKLCEKKKAKRECPGVGAGICPTCCGTHRENTVDCPLDCVYLREARLHEPVVELDPRTLPNADVRLNEAFLKEHEPLIVYLAMMLRQSMEVRKAVDNDAREALEAIIKTYRTRESGLIYEVRPQNPYAAGLQEDLNRSIDELRKRLAEQTGMQTLRDAELLGALVFIERLQLQHNNGRRRGRAFLDLLRTMFPQPAPGSIERPAGSTLIQV